MATKFLDLTGLSNYDTLIKQWVKALTDGLKSVSISKVDSLPEVSAAKQNVIYFVPAQGADSENTYDEYILVDGAFELIGTTRVSLEGYARQQWVTQQITAAIAAITKATSSKDGLMSKEDKAKLDSIAEGANKYVHPSHGAHASGLYKVTVDTLGHVTAAAPVEKEDITALGIPGSGYTLPTATASTLGGVKSKTTGTTSGRDYNVEVLTDGTMKVNVPWTDTNTTYAAITESEIAALFD